MNHERRGVERRSQTALVRLKPDATNGLQPRVRTPPYSWRTATIGSMLEARRAGT